MANLRFRSMPIYVSSKKIAELQNGSIEYDANDEAQEGTDGYLGHSDGIAMTKVDCDTIVPTTASSVNVLSLIKNKTDVTIAAQLEGRLVQATMRCVKFSAKSTSKNGTTKGSFSFEGGDLTGV